MPEKIYITNRMRNIIVLVLATIYILVCALSLITTRNWINKPFPGFLVLKNNIVPIIWLPDWEGFKRGIKYGDLVVAVNGNPVRSSDELDSYVLKSKIGDSLSFTVTRGIKGKQQPPINIPVSIFTLKDYLLISFVPMSFGILWYSFGLIVFYLKPNSTASWAFLFLGITIGMILGPSVEFSTNHHNFMAIIFLPCGGPAVFFLGLNFPVEYKFRRYIVAITMLITALIMSFYLYFYFSFQNDLFRFIDTFFIQAYGGVLALLGFFLLFRSFFISDDPLVRQRRKVVLYGFIVSSLGVLIFYIGTVIYKESNMLFAFVLISAVPLSIGYAIVKHNLFDVDVFIRRSFSYLLVSGIVVIMFFGLIAFLSISLGLITGSSSQIAAVLSTLLMVIIFRPLRDRVDKIIDRRFYREKYEYKTTIQKASEYLVSIIDLDQLLNQILDTVLDAIKIERGMILLREKDPERFQVTVARGYEDPESFEPFSKEHFLIQYLTENQKAVQINDVQELDEFAEYRDIFLRLIKGSGIILVIPVLYEQHLIGMLGLSEKKSGAWYSSEDIELLQTLMNHTAVSIENARKVEVVKRQEMMESKFARFMSPNLVKAMIEGAEDPFTTTKRKRLTVFFSDIRGFTALSDEMEAEESMELLNHYLQEMTTIIYQHEGTLDKFMGDGIMVFFNDPLDQDDHAARAVKMSVAMQKRMDELQEKWFEAGQKPLSIGIGINTGYMSVGGVGSERHMDYTVVGNQVNLAARLQGLASGGEIVISHSTYGQVKDLVEVEDRGEVKVRGLHQPVKIYKVTGLK
jgi:class 3 adenylate cyclase